MKKRRHFIKVFKEEAALDDLREIAGDRLLRIGIGAARRVVFELEGPKQPGKKVLKRVCDKMHDLFPDDFGPGGHCVCNMVFDPATNTYVVVCEPKSTDHGSDEDGDDQ